MLTSLVIGLLTLVLVLTSLLLILMILVQLPKKEAGLGMAFGDATATALFGAGSGTVLTRWTKYATGIFLALSLVLSVLRNHEHRASARNIADQLARQPQPAAMAPGTTSTGASPAAPVLTLPPAPNLAPPVTTSAPPVAPALPPPVNPVDDVVPPAP
jgi:preprotein translocase subunit SecG